MISQRKSLLLAVVVLAPAMAQGYSTKLHMITGFHISEMLKKNGCKLTLGGWNKAGGSLNLAVDMNGNRDVGKETHTIDLSGEVCRLITNPKTYPYFASATTGPDTFPGMFGNTDPTHALLWNTAWQIPVLWQNARTDEEKAFVLGWVVHFAGDLNAHGLANLHANGVWMAGGDVGTVWKHIVSETYYASNLLPYPKGFDNRLVWPKDYVKRMFFSPLSPLYKHWDYNWNRYIRQEDIGVVSKVFGGVLRAHFLLWDMHARETNRWEGRKEYFKPIKNKSVNDWFHWLFADQAWNFHKKKEGQARTAIDVWYEATHRAQQAIVADKDGIFKGDKKYDQPRPGKPPKRGVYKSGGIGGVVDSYKYWSTEGIWPLINPDLITITKENFPVLYSAIETIKKIGNVLAFIADALMQAFKAFIEVLTLPLKLIKEAIMAALQPMIDDFKE
ncbi:MAG: hypothetical protein HYY84_13815 [Deltaproteobacteria bacterium]|nr:hypothetical protein [Deltaproteobacteria bacterium]